MSELELWAHYKRHVCISESLGLRLDISRMPFDEDKLEELTPRMNDTLAAMAALEAGHRANVDEDRMVGHYWLRAPATAPTREIGDAIQATLASIKQFADDVHTGSVAPQRGGAFYVVLLLGIGGSALGPQFVSEALGDENDAMLLRVIDNTDPDGIDAVVADLDEELAETLTIVVSKSGGTVETRNAMLEVAAAYERHGLDFARHAVAVTKEGSPLYEKAVADHWLHVFPMWDWVGGRTSVMSAVGMLPAALQGLDIDAMLAGARDCDIVTRETDWRKNPAALLAAMWYLAGNGRGERDLVVLPYCDRLGFLGRYLQQLVMESLGKELDRKGNVVHQGMTVYGNKGSTDQHAMVQQLRDGPDRFFVTFIETLRDRAQPSMQVADDVTAGDYLHGLLYGTRRALYERGRGSITITLPQCNARTVGITIALFERAVGLYAELIDVNAYNQPGVEAGKAAAEALMHLQRDALRILRHTGGESMSADALAAAAGRPEAVEDVFHLLEHAAANPDHGIAREGGASPDDARYRAV